MVMNCFRYIIYNIIWFYPNLLRPNDLIINFYKYVTYNFTLLGPILMLEKSLKGELSLYSQLSNVAENIQA